MMMTVVIMFIENLPSIGWVYYSTQLAYCQSFPWNREAFQQFFWGQPQVYLTQNWDSDSHFEVSLNLNWYKSYNKKHKNAKNVNVANFCFCTKSQKKKK